jgi:hypothetical protein
LAQSRLQQLANSFDAADWPGELRVQPSAVKAGCELDNSSDLILPHVYKEWDGANSRQVMIKIGNQLKHVGWLDTTKNDPDAIAGRMTFRLHGRGWSARGILYPETDPNAVGLEVRILGPQPCSSGG